MSNGKPAEPEVWDVVIIGTGPAGLTAALYTARANLKPLLLHGDTPGGQLTTTTEIENFPGFVGGEGGDLIDKMTEQAQKFGTVFKYETIREIDVSSKPFVLKSFDKTIKCKAVILSTGARPRKLGLPSEDAYWSKGVTSCATCDGHFYKGMEVCVIGGGDSAMEEALYLTRLCTKVTIIHRRDKFRASKVMADRAMNNEKIKIMWDSLPEEVLGDAKKVNGIRVKNVKTGQVTDLPVSGVFLAIGHIPNTDFVKGLVETDEEGYIVTAPKSTRTNVSGIFACGDCQDKIYRQAITAAGTGCMAAIEVEKWLDTEYHA
eukprot:TRINITY_DN9198_c0_g1_i1.p1 TRINITY_DN9198_c0_g1~~TRINITY_DN9198_c0_g1_i1.p1  ORF type:complete len:318 (-),score=94.53 TRINITY_DN9198_c0_g1_i1:363-1316(-)